MWLTATVLFGAALGGPRVRSLVFGGPQNPLWSESCFLVFIFCHWRFEAYDLLSRVHITCFPPLCCCNRDSTSMGKGVCLDRTLKI